MSRLVDPTICPDCRGLLDAKATCTACGLQVQGPLAAELWATMLAADRIVEQLRSAAPWAVPAQTPDQTPAQMPAGATSYPVAPPQARRPKRHLPAASVPVVLLSLGALCLLVAAVVFVAVTWSVLGLTGRTLVLLGVTLALTTVAVVLTRKGLRGAAETFWLIVAGMVTLDLLAAEAAGLAGLDTLSSRQTGALVGVALVLLGVGVGVWARTQPVTRLLGAETVAVIGALVLCTTNGWGAVNPALGTVFAVPALVAAALALWRTVPVTARGMGVLAALSWVVLVGLGWDRTLERAELSAWWSDFRGWPLLVAAAFGALAVHAPRVPTRARPLLAALALVPLVMLANGPLTFDSATRDLLVWCATLAALALITAAAPRDWGRGAAVLTALGVAALGLVLVAWSWIVLLEQPTDGLAKLDLTTAPPEAGAPASWTAGIAGLALVAGLGALLRHVPTGWRPSATAAVAALAPAVMALGALNLVLGLEPPLWGAVLAAALAAAVAGGAAWWCREDLVAGALGGAATAYLSLVALYAASAADLLTGIVATVMALALAGATFARERVRARVSAAITAGLAALVGGWALHGWGQAMEADYGAIAIALAGYAALVGILAAPVSRQVSTRITLEGSAAVLALASAGYAPDDATIAMTQTIVGTAICVIAVANRDRRFLGWVGATVLGLATLVRVAADIAAPELYTLPAAALLVGVGVWRLRSDAESGSLQTLGSGLTLALLPSLLLALDEPVSLRGALIGAGGVLVLAAGVQYRLAVPFVLGAGTTALLALRHLEPIADAVPRWISLGTLGVALLIVGITWEARRSNLDTARRYLTALR